MIRSHAIRDPYWIPWDTPVHYCSRCAYSTIHPHRLAAVDGFLGPRILCPECYRIVKERARIRLWLLTAVGVSLILLLPSGNPPYTDIPAPITFLLTWIIAQPIVTILHELGHATAGRLLGFRLFVICIGLGRLLCRFTVKGVRIDLRLLPGGY